MSRHRSGRRVTLDAVAAELRLILEVADEAVGDDPHHWRNVVRRRVADVAERLAPR